MIGNGPHCRFRVHVRKPVSFKTRGMCLFVYQALFWPKCPVHENRHNSRFGSHPMPIVAARSDICNMTHLVPAAAGGCYVGAPPRPAARSMKFLSLLCRAAQDIAGAVYTKACHTLFPRRVSAHCIHWTAGKLLFRLQSEHGVRSGADAECSFPDGHAQRSRRREQSERPG